MTIFRPCIDLHDGQVKQIVGGSLRDDSQSSLVENFVSDRSAQWFAEKYRADGLFGGHVIQLGPGNAESAIKALSAFPGGLQLGGGVSPENARTWLEAGASQVIVTSYLFEGGKWSERRLAELLDVVHPAELVIDLSCRRTPDGYFVSTNRWQTTTDTRVDAALLERLAESCAEFLVHAADVEGLCQGIESELVQLLGEASPVPCTYAGGAKSIADLEQVESLSNGRVDLTFGSALDLFGGSLVRYQDCLIWNQKVPSRG